MSENICLEKTLPEVEETNADCTTPQDNEIFVPVKFNKQVLNLNLEKAQEMAQKGMKFDLISKDYEALKNLAKADGKSVGEFISEIKRQKDYNRQNEILGKCGDDSDFAQYVLNLENAQGEDIKGFAELCENFPQFKNIADLPESVVEAAEMKGTLLLDEYLRYLHNQDTIMKNSIKSQREACEAAMGSMLSKNGGENPETAEFLRGLWSK